MRSLFLLVFLAWVTSSSVVWAQPNFVAKTVFESFEEEASEGFGEFLISKLQCARCHEPPAALQDRLMASPLMKLQDRVGLLRSDYLAEFLSNVHVTDSTSRMPDLLVGKSEQARFRVALALRSFLVSESSPEDGLTSFPAGDDQRGRALFLSIGCVACHQDSLAENGSHGVPSTADELGAFQKRVAQKFTRRGLFQYLRPSNEGHRPKLRLSAEESADLASVLSSHQGDVNIDETAQSDHLIAEGRQLFEGLQCVSCHEFGGVQLANRSKNLLGLKNGTNESEGCLAESPKNGVPWFRLSDVQRESLRMAISSLEEDSKFSTEQLLFDELTKNDCFSCHRRDGVGGPTSVTDPHFISRESDLGDEGRLPPDLTGVGRKLTHEAIQRVIAGDAQARPYMVTRMPVYESELGTRLAEMFAALDIPVDEKATLRQSAENQVGRNMWGRALIGSEGLGCISCHQLGGRPSLGIQAMDLELAPDRLRPEWFRDYLLNPAGFRPQTRMPAFWPDGKPSLAGHGGSALRQIDSLWAYLNELDQSRLPLGLVDKEALILRPLKRPLVFRTFMKGVGNHAIAVGFEAGTHVAFDALQVRLALTWRGAFLDAESTWEDRFTPLTEPEGQDLTMIQSIEPLWEGPVSFRGYSLEAESGLPHFHYEVEELVVDDSFQARDEMKSGLLRIIKTRGSPSPVWLDIASGERLRSVDGSLWGLGEKLRIETAGKVRLMSTDSGDHLQVLVPATNQYHEIAIVYEW